MEGYGGITEEQWVTFGITKSVYPDGWVTPYGTQTV